MHFKKYPLECLRKIENICKNNGISKEKKNHNRECKSSH